ncbi:MAG: PorP/SprF family type IX secretion system membrane protein [Chitinophagales bacterium]
MARKSYLSLLKRRLALGTLCMLFQGLLMAQSYNHFTLHQYNPSYLNPASAAQHDAVRLAAFHRSQYVGLSSEVIGAQVVSVDAKLPNSPFTTGMHFSHDYIGLQRSMGLRIDGGWQAIRKDNFLLTTGFGLGFRNLSWDGNQMITPEGLYTGGIDHQDEVLFNTVFNAQGFEWRGGIQLKYKRLAVDFGSLNFPTARRGGENNYNVKASSQSWLRMKYQFDVGDQWRLIPQTLVLTDGRIFQYSLSVHLTHDKWLLGLNQRGLSSTSLEALGTTVGYNFGKNFQVLYNYEYNLSLLKSVNVGSHELCLKWRRPLKARTGTWGRVYHGRYL